MNVAFGAPAFALPRMPTYADSGTVPLAYVVERLREHTQSARLLRELAPAEYTRLRGRGCRAFDYLAALMKWIERQGLELRTTAEDLVQYELDCIYEAEAQEEEDVPLPMTDAAVFARAIAYAEAGPVPVFWKGFEIWEYTHHDKNESFVRDAAVALARIAASVILLRKNEIPRDVSSCERGLARMNVPALQPTPAAVAALAQQQRLQPPPDIGGIWSGAMALMKWVAGETDLIIADTSSDDMIDGVPWHAAEIRNLIDEAAMWKPMEERIHALIHFVNASPVRRVPLLWRYYVGAVDATELEAEAGGGR